MLFRSTLASLTPWPATARGTRSSTAASVRNLTPLRGEVAARNGTLSYPAIVQLNPPIWLDTPHGRGIAYFLRDPGPELDAEWGVAIQEGPYVGQIWWTGNPDVRLIENWTLRRPNARDCWTSKEKQEPT